MNIQLSDRFTYGKLFRFTLPSVVMMVFTSIYGVVDGFFVSNDTGYGRVYVRRGRQRPNCPDHGRGGQP